MHLQACNTVIIGLASEIRMHRSSVSDAIMQHVCYAGSCDICRNSSLKLNALKASAGASHLIVT